MRFRGEVAAGALHANHFDRIMALPDRFEPSPEPELIPGSFDSGLFNLSPRAGWERANQKRTRE